MQTSGLCVCVCFCVSSVDSTYSPLHTSLHLPISPSLSTVHKRKNTHTHTHAALKKSLHKHHMFDSQGVQTHINCVCVLFLLFFLFSSKALYLPPSVTLFTQVCVHMFSFVSPVVKTLCLFASFSSIVSFSVMPRKTLLFSISDDPPPPHTPQLNILLPFICCVALRSTLLLVSRVFFYH